MLKQWAYIICSGKRTCRSQSESVCAVQTGFSQLALLPKLRQQQQQSCRRFGVSLQLTLKFAQTDYDKTHISMSWTCKEHTKDKEFHHLARGMSFCAHLVTLPLYLMPGKKYTYIYILITTDNLQASADKHTKYLTSLKGH